MILTVSLSTLAVLYFPLSFYFFSGKTLKDQNLLLSIAAGWFLSVVPVGVMFKLRHLPGSQLYLLVGLIGAVIFLLITWLLRSKQEHLLNYYNQMLIRTGVLGALALLLYLIP